jgi:hypothetical protein
MALSVGTFVWLTWLTHGPRPAEWWK